MHVKTRKIYACSQCDAQFPAWQGRCTECGNWGTVQESVRANTFRDEKQTIDVDISKLNISRFDAIPSTEGKRLKTGIGELDNVLGGGIVPGSLLLLGGEPGIGKSTLCLQLLSTLAAHGGEMLYVSGEESATQVKLRAQRLKIATDNIQLLCETHLETIVSALKKLKPGFAIIDSIQTLSSVESPTETGNITQIKIAATKLLEVAKKDNIPLLITGHVTKDGFLAGPKVLEHLVDVVLSLEGDKNTSFRILRATKNRFGSTNEIGVFEMNEHGMTEVKNPSAYFLNEHARETSGSCKTCIIQGTKVFMLEVQALVTKTHFGNALRKTSGFDINRLALLCAVLSNRANIPLQNFDVFLNIVGGLKIKEPALDLAVVYALLSAYENKKTIPKAVVFGEIGLGGEVRKVAEMEKRMKEATKLGYEPIILPFSSSLKKSTQVIALQHISELRKYLIL